MGSESLMVCVSLKVNAYLDGIMGRVTVHLHGKSKNKSARAMIEDYLQRLSNRGISLEVHPLRGGVQFYEARLGALKGELILMDETGEMHDSEEFAAWLADSALSTEQIHIAVAAAEGFSADIKSQATALFSLSLLTMPHELCRCGPSNLTGGARTSVFSKFSVLEQVLISSSHP